MAGSSGRRNLGWERHVIDSISYRAETVSCSCGWFGKTTPDLFEHDRHLPLANAFLEHRIQVGAIRTGGRAARQLAEVEVATE